MNLAFLGIQGSGKGTQAGLLKKKYGFEHVNIGELLRSHMARKTLLGLKITSYMEQGDLVPDNYIFTVLEDKLHKNSHGLIFDGFPRTINQAEYMEEKIPVAYAVFFDLDDKIAIERITSRRVCSNCGRVYNLILNPPKEDMKCDHCGGQLIQRNDDHEAAIKRRLNIFHNRTKPVIAFFEERDCLIKIDASQSPEQIHKILIKEINLEK